MDVGGGAGKQTGSYYREYRKPWKLPVYRAWRTPATAGDRPDVMECLLVTNLRICRASAVHAIIPREEVRMRSLRSILAASGAALLSVCLVVAAGCNKS